jgi:hypothetical protein
MGFAVRAPARSCLIVPSTSDRTRGSRAGSPNLIIVFAWRPTIEGSVMRTDWISPTPLEIAMSIAAKTYHHTRI